MGRLPLGVRVFSLVDLFLLLDHLSIGDVLHANAPGCPIVTAKASVPTSKSEPKLKLEPPM